MGTTTIMPMGRAVTTITTTGTAMTMITAIAGMTIRMMNHVAMARPGNRPETSPITGLNAGGRIGIPLFSFMKSPLIFAINGPHPERRRAGTGPESGFEEKRDMTAYIKTMDLRSVLKHGLIAFMAAGLIMGAFASVAMAEKGGKGNGKPEHVQGQHEDRDHDRGHEGRHGDDDLVSILIGDQDRRVLNDYLNRNYRKDCPPGLAKKNNGCLPPGIAKKYRVGYPLPDDVRFMPLPRDLRDLLSPAPRGYQYVQVDKDILLISEASKKVIDAVTLLSAVGN